MSDNKSKNGNPPKPAKPSSGMQQGDPQQSATLQQQGEIDSPKITFEQLQSLYG